MYERFQELLRLNNTSVAALCRDTGLKESSLSNWKKRNKGISTDTLIIICGYFNVSSDWLLGLNNNPPIKSNRISDFEYKIIVEYRKLLPLQQDVILNSLQIQRPVERKTQNEA